MSVESVKNESLENRGPLWGLKGIELTNTIAGSYCGKLLADFGVEVLKIEKPRAGDDARNAGPFFEDRPNPEASGLFLFLNTSKLGITLEVTDPLGRDIFERLCGEADLLIVDSSTIGNPDHPFHTEWVQRFPQLIVVVLTPYGLSSPQKHYAANELTVMHESGVAYYTPGDAGDAEKEMPLQLPGHQAEFMGGMNGATAAMLAVLHRRRTGKGQIVDVSLRDGPLLSNIWNMGHLAYTGEKPTRMKGEVTLAPQHVVPCKDGYIQLSCGEEAHWQKFLSVIGNPEWGNREMFKDRFARGRNWELLLPLITHALREWGKKEITEAGQAAGVPVTPVNTSEDIFKDRHLAERGFFCEVDRPPSGKLKIPGRPFIMEKSPWQLRRRAPTLGEHNEEIFVGRLGFTNEELTSMRKLGVI